MKRVFTYLTVVALTGSAASGFAQCAINSTQFDWSAGPGKVYTTDKSGLSYNVSLKRVHQFCGTLYVDAGISYTGMSSSYQLNEETLHRHLRSASYVSVPVGAGFTMGDDRAGIICGIDLLPSYYVTTSADIVAPRKLGLGLAPEFGFLFKVGRADRRGISLGMMGKLQLLQPASKADDNGFRYGFAGIGAVMRF